MSGSDLIENRTFDEIEIGDSAMLEKRLTMEDIKLFAVMSGDVNPAHVDEEFARSSRFHELIAHGMWGGALISTVLGTQLPGPGTIYLGQTLRFRGPVTLGDQIRVKVTATEKDEQKGRITFACEGRNQEDALVLDGEAKVLAPTDKISRPRAVMPTIRLAEEGHLSEMLADADAQEPTTAAVVHPVDIESMQALDIAVQRRLIRPVLVGPLARMQAAADDAGVDISGFEQVATQHSHGAAKAAVDMVSSGDVAMLIKGGLATDELLGKLIDPRNGLRTEREPSQVMAFDVPTYPRPLLISDPLVNIHPTLFEKRDIVSNMALLAHALGIHEPRIAMLSSSEAIDPKLSSTLDAAAICKMADRGQVKGAVIDGPMAFDAAISAATARSRGLESPVAGRADGLIAPDLEAASMLVKQLSHLADARGAGLLMGLRVPVVMSTRDDNVASRLTGIALARCYLAHLEHAGRDAIMSAAG
ncbi:bifunctional enoyl-CoA hydratase/phosphate acetyltransferase [Spiribacter vilamensis]|nr:bifunctional enoyl-CoA hydratase/phosphate acetyltransferase [Spiribacter vilamensis]TVO60817.1 bifunctional enoyl-CoA hydratase/phosphate acetyltransferase [Spiribacter vilamensis]